MRSAHRGENTSFDPNMTMRSKESGTNVSYQSNYSAIKSNIMRFKNKRNTV